MKIKLILFGAAEIMFQAAKENLNDDCEIIAFCDNNEFKQGIIWNDLPIISINDLKNFNFDFVIVGAWFSYHIIRKNLLDAGIDNKKILPLLSLKSFFC